MAKMKSLDFVSKLIDIANNYKTLYVMGCFGAPMNATNKNRYINNGAHNNYNAQSSRKAMINAASADTFGFDCVCLIKGVLWGWSGDKNKVYGGAGYVCNGVPDIGADSMINVCTGVSTTGWANMVPGEAVWLSGHIGVYIGNGLAVECSPAFANKVQITAVSNIGTKAGYSARKWTKHGKLPYLDYSDQTSSSSTPAPATTTGLAPQDTKADEKATYDFLMAEIGNIFGVCGLMANLFYESGLIPNNLQNTGNTKLGMTDAEYTNAVDNGTYTKFAVNGEGHGYGLAQWTYYTRKAALLAFAKAQKASIGNRDMQHKFLVKELKESFPKVWNTLKTATSVQQASDAVLLDFERPANAASHKDKRAAKGVEYYNKYSSSKSSTGSTPTSTPVTEKKATQAAQKKDNSLAGTYTVTASSGLHIRTKAGGTTADTSMAVLPNGTKVNNYGYYNLVGNTKWLYVQVTYNGVKYTGFCSSAYLKKA
ncbi:MAG: phage tail tip lysozyme [Lachnospiraceae bacterium]|nr:phage tail tip lysozyme [Lachnospiraceae bacterium]